MSSSEINKLLPHSNIRSRDSTKKESIMGLLGKRLTVANKAIPITQADPDKKWFSAQIIIPNASFRTSASKIQITIYVSDKQEPTDEDLYTEVGIEVGATFTWGDIRMNPYERLFVKCDVSGIPVRVEGYADGMY